MDNFKADGYVVARGDSNDAETVAALNFHLTALTGPIFATLEEAAKVATDYRAMQAVEGTDPGEPVFYKLTVERV